MGRLGEATNKASWTRIASKLRGFMRRCWAYRGIRIGTYVSVGELAIWLDLVKRADVERVLGMLLGV